jgi:hypothetical protein
LSMRFDSRQHHSSPLHALHTWRIDGSRMVEHQTQAKSSIPPLPLISRYSQTTWHLLQAHRFNRLLGWATMTNEIGGTIGAKYQHHINSIARHIRSLCKVQSSTRSRRAVVSISTSIQSHAVARIRNIRATLLSAFFLSLASFLISFMSMGVSNNQHHHRHNQSVSQSVS